MRTILVVQAWMMIGSSLVGQSPGTGSTPSEGDSAMATGLRVERPYDTLTVTTPRYAELTVGDRTALAAFAAASLPVNLALVTASVAPPAVVILREGELAFGGVAVSTGFGFGRRWEDLAYWPELRLQVEWAHLFRRPIHTLVRLSVLRDFPVLPVSDRQLFWLGASAGVGLSRDVAGTSGYVEGSLVIMNPMGINFMMLFPMHTWGIRSRIGTKGDRSQWWYEFSFGGSATFAF